MTDAPVEYMRLKEAAAIEEAKEDAAKKLADESHLSDATSRQARTSMRSLAVTPCAGCGAASVGLAASWPG